MGFHAVNPRGITVYARDTIWESIGTASAMSPARWLCSETRNVVAELWSSLVGDIHRVGSSGCRTSLERIGVTSSSTPRFHVWLPAKSLFWNLWQKGWQNTSELGSKDAREWLEAVCSATLPKEAQKQMGIRLAFEITTASLTQEGEVEDWADVPD